MSDAEIVERVRHILSSGYGCEKCAYDDLRVAVGLSPLWTRHTHI